MLLRSQKSDYPKKRIAMSSTPKKKTRAKFKDLVAKDSSKVKGGMNKQDLVAEIPKKSGVVKPSS
jgi:hypothetical protein